MEPRDGAVVAVFGHKDKQSMKAYLGCSDDPERCPKLGVYLGDRNCLYRQEEKREQGERGGG